MKLRIVLADDSDLMLQSLAALLEQKPNYDIVGRYQNGRELTAAVKELRPDVALVDVAMPECNGLDALAEIKRVSPKTRVILLSIYTDEEYVRRAIEEGAAGYIIKDGAVHDLEAAIRNGHRGNIYFSHELEAVAAALKKGGGKENLVVGLSPRERQVLQMIAEGHTTAQIAELLNIEETTVKTHRDHIMEKTGRRSIALLTRLAMRLKLVRED